MFFSKKNINCQENIDEIRRIIGKLFLNSSDFKVMGGMLRGMKSSFEENIGSNKNLSAFELDIFSKFCMSIDGCIRYSDREEKDNLRTYLDGSLKLLDVVYADSVCYLIRHPDPDPMSYAEQAYGNLSGKGMEEAVKFAEAVAKEILLCPKKVRIHIFYTARKRTKLFGDIVAHKIKQIKANNRKDVEIVEYREEKALVTPAVKEVIERYPDKKEIFDKISKGGMNAELRKRSVEALKLWLMNFSSSRDCASSLGSFIDNCVNNDSSKEWNMFLLFTHDITIAAYMHHALGFSIDESFVSTAEFIKKNRRGFSFRNTWH